jgi:predicted methyltransferase
MKTEQDFLNELAELDKVWLFAKKKLAEAKKLLMENETRIIELKLQKDRLTEELRIFRNTSVECQLASSRDIEVASFKERNPEVCKMANDRDEQIRTGKK